MKSSEIVRLLKIERVTQRRIAEELGIKQPTVNQVIHKRQTSRRIQDHICEIIRYSFKEVWEENVIRS